MQDLPPNQPGGTEALAADIGATPLHRRAPRGSRLARYGHTAPETVLESVLENAPDALVVSDRQGKIVLVNRQTERLFGERREDVLGQPVERLLPDALHDTHRQYRAAYSAASRTGPMRLSDPHVAGRRQDGSTFPAEVSLAEFVVDGGETYVIATIRDVSALHRAQAAQQAAESAAEDLRHLQAVTDTALSHLDLHDLLAALLARVRAALAVDYASVSLLEAERQELRLEAAEGPGPVPAAAAPIPVGQGMAGRVAATRAPLVVDDLSTFPVVNAAFFAGQRSAVGVPLLAGREQLLLGVLVVSVGQPRQFTPHDVLLLERVAERIALAMKQSQLYAAERSAHAEAEAARAEAARRAEELSRVFEAMADGVAVYDQAGRPVRANAALHTLLGLDGASLDYIALSLDERVARFGTRDLRSRPLAPATWPVARALAGEVVTGADAEDMQVRTLDGRDVEMRVSAAPVRSPTGQLMGAVGIFRDQTERNRLAREREAALVASEAWFHTLADTAPVLIWVSGADGLVTFVNLPWLQFTGRTLQQELGDGWAEGVHPDDYDRCLQTYRTAFDARQPFTMEYRLRRADGEYRWLLDTGVPRYASDGAFIGYIGSCADITVRQELEQARASELALREVNERLDTFATVAAHELRGPVTATKLGIQLAERQVAKAAAQVHGANAKSAQPFIPVTRALGAAEQDLDRLWRLMQQLLDVTQARQGTLTLDRRPCDLADIVRTAVEEQRLLTPDRVVTLALPTVPALVEADADRVGQVVGNYLSNAVRYTPDDRPIAMTLRVLEPETAEPGDGGLEAAAPEAAGGRVARVEVRDQGPGIAPEDLATIWERFQRARTVREVRGGLGLGLYIARTIIELHGGQVGVDSVVGQGATFWFTLPLMAPAAPVEPAADAGHATDAADAADATPRSSGASGASS